MSDTDLFYEGQHASVIPSVLPEEFSRVCAESQARGLPVVVTDTGGTQELVKGNGIVVPMREPKALATALLDVLGDETRRAEWGRVSREIALSLSWSSMGLRYMELCGRTRLEPESIVCC